MNTLIKNPHTIFSTEEAEKLVATLNADKDEDWTYKVSVNPKNEDRAIIEIFDEDNIFIDYL